LPTIWKFLPTKSVRCKTGLFWPDWWKIRHQAIFYSNQLWLITYCFSLTATNFLAHFFCPPLLQAVSPVWAPKWASHKIIGLFVITIRRKWAYYWHSDHIALSDILSIHIFG
jgi:hypothetical protein